MGVVDEAGGEVLAVGLQRAGGRASFRRPALQVAADRLWVATGVAGDRRDRPAASSQCMDLHDILLCEHSPGPSFDRWRRTPRPLRRPLTEAWPAYAPPPPYGLWLRAGAQAAWGISVIRSGESCVIADTFAVIDGQQRLTTLVMLLCALRDAAELVADSALANGTHTFIERKDENDEDRFALKTESSYPFLQDQVLSRGVAQLNTNVGKEEESIQVAFLRVSKYIDELLEHVENDNTVSQAKKEDAKAAKLKEIRDRILDLRLILIEVDDQDGATTIFVTLNSRGKDLEPADLVKAHLLNLLPKSGSLDRPLERWEAISDKFDQSQVKGLTMTKFLHASWRSRYGNATEANLAKKVRKEIKKANAETYLKELEKDAELYRQINEPEYRAWTKSQDEAKESLFFFGNFGIEQPMPLLLSMMRAFDEKLISIKQLKRALKAIEDYHFAFTLLGSKTSSGGMSAFFAKRARELLAADTKPKRAGQIDSLVIELKAKRPSKAEFNEGFVDLWLTDDVTADKRTVRYVLRRFYMHHAPRAAVDFRKMTVEHLSPQSARGTSVGRLGNLIFVDADANSGVLSAKGFAAKQAELKKVKQWIPQEILDASTWGTAQINKRTRTMAEQARTAVFAG